MKVELYGEEIQPIDADVVAAFCSVSLVELCNKAFGASEREKVIIKFSQSRPRGGARI